MQKIDGKAVTVYLMNDQIERLEKIAKRHGLKKAKATRIILDVGLDSYDAYSAIGVPQLAHRINKIKQAIREAAQAEKQPRLF